jgi:hypothetical protein
LLVHAAAEKVPTSSSPRRRAWEQAFNFDQINNSIAAIPKVEWEFEEQSKNNNKNYIDTAIENIKRVAAGGEDVSPSINIYANYSPKNYRKQLVEQNQRKLITSPQHLNATDYVEDRLWRRTVNESISTASENNSNDHNGTNEPPLNTEDLLAESPQQQQQFTNWEKERNWIKTVASDMQNGKLFSVAATNSAQSQTRSHQSSSTDGGAVVSTSFNMDKLSSILGMFEKSLLTFHKLIDKIEEKQTK